MVKTSTEVPFSCSSGKKLATESQKVLLDTSRQGLVRNTFTWAFQRMGFGQVVPHLIAGGSLIHCYLLHLVLFEPRSPRSLPETCQLQNCQPSTGAGDKLQAQAGHRPGTMHRNPHSGLASAPGVLRPKRGPRPCAASLAMVFLLEASTSFSAVFLHSLHLPLEGAAMSWAVGVL